MKKQGFRKQVIKYLNEKFGSTNVFSFNIQYKYSVVTAYISGKDIQIDFDEILEAI